MAKRIYTDCVKRYYANSIDRIALRFPKYRNKEERERYENQYGEPVAQGLFVTQLKAAAKAKGLSVNGYIRDCVYSDMDISVPVNKRESQSRSESKRGS